MYSLYRKALLNTYISYQRHCCRSIANLSQFNRLVKSEEFRVYRLCSPCPEIFPGSGLLNRVALHLHQAWKKLRKVEAKAIMPPKPPESVRGMRLLVRDAFTSTIQVPSIDVPFAHVGAFQKLVKKHLIKLHGVRPVAEPAAYDLKKDHYRLFLLDPDKFFEASDLPKTLGDEVDLAKFGVELSSWKILNIKLSYENWHYDDILNAILPEESDGVGGFSSIGHIIHLNLKEELNDYKKIIGEVLLDKIPYAETVVNKTNTIDNTYRNFSMEVIAGKDNFITVAKENGQRFEMDFSKVYWNPRLGTEHQRIVSQLKTGDILYDVFAGIGPFSVPAVKRGCTVFANDLNPESFKWLKTNIKPKKIFPDPQLYNLDGREFIRTVVMNDIKKRWNEASTETKCKYNIHVVMNLPALAIEFLDAFCGLLSDFEVDSAKNVPLPNVHCYSFSKAADPVADIKERVEAVIGSTLPEGHSIRLVRNVAPNKEMLCAKFELQKDILVDGEMKGKSDATSVGPPLEIDATSIEPPLKKTKIEDDGSAS